MSRVKYLIGIIILIFNVSCNQPSSLEKDLRKSLNKTVNINMFKHIQKNDTIQHFWLVNIIIKNFFFKQNNVNLICYL